MGCNDKTSTTSDSATNTNTTANPAEPPPPPVPVRRPNVSQQFVGIDIVNVRLAKALDELPYELDGLSDDAKAVNQAVWSPASSTVPADPDASVTPAPKGKNARKKIDVQPMDEKVALRIQALLNWHHHGVGAVDGRISGNTVKAMNVFQEKHGLPISKTMNEQTWQALSANSELMAQPVLVRYTLTSDDVKLYGGRSQYVSVSEKVAEKFHMSQTLLKKLNPDTPLKAGNTITVYNPHQPNETAVTKVKVKRKENILFAYDKDDNLVASYPTTVNLARTPKGNYKVTSRVMKPTYNSDFRTKKGIIEPGPNNPVGLVWLGISKPSFGIHGSPYPEKISNQTSAGCVRLTNWDALGLYGAIEEGAEVEFL